MAERLNVEDLPKAGGHFYRYQLALDFLRDGDMVADIACGIGYGSAILTKPGVEYIGVDKVEPAEQFKNNGMFITGVDLNQWFPDFEWDVSVSFETLEHVEDPARFAQVLKQAQRMIILSTPTRPTKHVNPYHLHDFTVDDVLALFDDWELVHIEDQPEELSHIFIWEPRAI